MEKTKRVESGILKKRVDVGVKEMNEVLQARKEEVVKKSKEYLSLSEEMKKEIDSLEVAYTETRFDGVFDVIWIFFDTNNKRYAFAIAKVLGKDDIVEEEYHCFGLGEKTVNNDFLGVEEVIPAVSKEIVIEMVEKIGYEFFTEEKQEEYKKELELFNQNEK